MNESPSKRTKQDLLSVRTARFNEDDEGKMMPMIKVEDLSSNGQSRRHS